MISKDKGQTLGFIMGKVHKYVTNSQSYISWHSLVDSTVVQSSNRCFRKCNNEPASHLTNSEQKILYYVAGYVIYSLKNKYNRMLKSLKSKEIAVAPCQILDSLQVSGVQSIKAENVLSFTHKWVSQ